MLRSSTADLAIDLGTSNTRIVARGMGVVHEAPTAVAIKPGLRGSEVVAVGKPARRMLGRTPEAIKVIRPVRGGVIADFDATELLLRHLFKQVGARSLRKPRVLVCVPTGTTEVERRAVQECVRAAGAREVVLAATGMAAAIGADIPVMEPSGSLIVDIGGGRTDIAIVSLGGLVVRRSIQVAGRTFDDALTRWVRQHHALLIGDATAEAMKLRIGSAAQVEPERTMRVRGRDLPTGAPRECDLTSWDTAEALHDDIDRIRQTVVDALREAPPEVAADIHDRGLVLCGGGGALATLDRVLSDATGLPVLQPDLPERCVVRGGAVLLEDAALFERVAQAQ